MPFQLKLQPDLLRIVVTGRLTRDEVVALGTEVRKLEETCGRLPNRLTDVSGVETSEISGDDVREFARRRREARHPNPFRNALVAPQPIQFGYARMFQTLADHPDIATQVFRDEASALAWLRGAPTPPHALPHQT